MNGEIDRHTGQNILGLGDNTITSSYACRYWKEAGKGGTTLFKDNTGGSDDTN